MRRDERENPHPVDSLAAETGRGSDSIAKLSEKILRYEKAKQRGISMRDYISKVIHQTDDSRKVAHNLHECGSYLVFRHYLNNDLAKLIAARTCKQHIICPFCAIRRGSKMLARYNERVELVMHQNPELVPWMVTFTVKNGSDLSERYSHLHNSVKRMNKYRHLDRGYEIFKVAGSVSSYEFKRGENSGLWHPHMHGVWLCTSPLDVKKLSDEWHKITGDSYIIEAHPLYGNRVDAFCEVFKYAVKFGGLPLADNWDAFVALRGKRLVRSTGLLWGVEIPEELTDDELDDPEYVDMIYRYFHDSETYRICETSHSKDVAKETLKRARGSAPTQPPEPYKKGRSHLLELQKKYG